MRFALAPNGTRGDIHPMIALGERLRGAGHEAVLCAAPDFRAAAERRGLEFRPIGRTVREVMGERAAEWAGGTRRSLKAINHSIREAVAWQFDELPDAVRGADCLIGAGVQVGGASVAEALGIPYRFVAYCPAVFESRRHPPILFPLARIPRFTYGLAWWMVRKSYGGWLGADVNRRRAALGLPPVHELYDHVMGERPLLLCDGELAPAPTDSRPAPVQTGYLMPDDPTPLPAELAAFLDAGSPPVYVGFGSMSDGDPAATTGLIVDALRALGRRGLVAHGGAGLAEAPLPAGFHAVGECDHAKLFPRTAAVVHHGGAGTTATAARAGVPQVVVPHITEQSYWGRAARGAGIAAAPIPRDQLTAKRLAAALAAVLDAPAVARRVAEIGERLRAADPGARVLEALQAATNRMASAISAGTSSWRK